MNACGLVGRQKLGQNYYVHKEIFPKDTGRKISRLEIIRHKRDYDTFYIASKDDAVEQIEVAEEVVKLVEKYLRD